VRLRRPAVAARLILIGPAARSQRPPERGAAHGEHVPLRDRR
jgi:hypothetical protein